MEKEFLKNRLETEQERCLDKLAELEPGSDEYGKCLYSTQHLTDWLRCAFSEDGSVPAPVPAAVTAEAPADPVPGGAPATEPAYKKEDVRAALAEARMKGVDVSKLISDVGAANLSAVDPADYPKLMDALAKELEGK